MGEEQPKHVEPETSPQEKTPNHDSYEKALVPIEKPIYIAEKAADHQEDEKSKMDSKDRVAALARVELEKRLALIKAWEESAKAKVDNKAYKKLSAIGAWENTKKASVDAELKQMEEEFEKKAAKLAEKMKNKVAELHKEAEEQRATTEAKRGENILKVEEAAAKFRATNSIPKRFFGCFSC